MTVFSCMPPFLQQTVKKPRADKLLFFPLRDKQFSTMQKEALLPADAQADTQADAPSRSPLPPAPLLTDRGTLDT